MSRTYLTTHQVARMVGASPSTVLSWVDRGWLPAHRTPGGHRRIDRQALVEFLRAHDMPELVSDSEPLKVLLALRSIEDAKQLAETVHSLRPDWRIDATEGVIETLARLFESPPDALVVDATLAGIDIEVLCRELGACPASARVRMLVVRPNSSSILDKKLRDAGVWTIVDAPVTAAGLVEQLSVDDTELARPKAS